MRAAQSGRSRSRSTPTPRTPLGGHRGVPRAGRDRPGDDRAATAPRRPACGTPSCRGGSEPTCAWTNRSGRRRARRSALRWGRAGSSTSSRAGWGACWRRARVHDMARAAGVPVWCGGMLETGIGRAQNLALAAMPGFTLPGDTSASARYFLDDLTEPFVMAARRHHGGARPGRASGSRLGPTAYEACTLARRERFDPDRAHPWAGRRCR